MSASGEARAVLNAYLEHFPEDAERLTLLRKQLANREDMFRKNFRGHLTAAGVVFNSERTAVLLIHHRALDRWLQPGGHIEPGDVDLLTAARREVAEETGQTNLEQIVLFGDPLMPADIETHYIPARPQKNEPEHYHHDFRYVFVARSTDTAKRVEEVRDVAWVPLDDERFPQDLRSVIGRVASLAP